MTEQEFYSLIEGRDDDGTPKAMCTLGLLTVNDASEITELATAASLNGAVYLALIPGGLSMIDIMFDEPTDYDYLQLGGVCEMLNKEIANANRNGAEPPSLTLTLTQQGDFQTFLTATDCVWSYIPTSAEKICTGIRLITSTDNINFLELDDGQVDEMIEDMKEQMFMQQFNKDDDY